MNVSDDDEDFVHDESETVPTEHNIDQNDFAPPAKKRKVYSAEEICEVVNITQYSVLAQKKGIPPSTIYTWIKKASKPLPTDQLPTSSKQTTKQPPMP